MTEFPLEINTSDLWAIYQTVWGEARGETFKGKLAVAYVILNRVEDDRWPDTAYEVVHQPWQFSAWNERNPNRAKMENLSPADLNKECMEATLMAVAETEPDPTKKATHYFASYISPPDWAANLTHTVDIGTHRFYK